MVDWWFFLKPEIIQLRGCHAFLSSSFCSCSVVSAWLIYLVFLVLTSLQLVSSAEYI